MPALPLFDDPFLRAQWSGEFDAFQAGPESAALHARLRAWAARDQLNERATETAFIQRFFVETWGYHLQGHESQKFTCRPQFEVFGAGQTGGKGFADLALGHFITDDELTLLIAGRKALHLYDRPDTLFIAAQRRHTLRDLNVTEAFDAKRLVRLLLTLRTTTEAPLRERILTLDTEINTLDQTIASREAELNELIYKLYKLTSEEIKMVDGG